MKDFAIGFAQLTGMIVVLAMLALVTAAMGQ